MYGQSELDSRAVNVEQGLAVSWKAAQQFAELGTESSWLSLRKNGDGVVTE
jgi:hypothetical protein